MFNFNEDVFQAVDKSMEETHQDIAYVVLVADMPQDDSPYLSLISVHIGSGAAERADTHCAKLSEAFYHEFFRLRGRQWHEDDGPGDSPYYVEAVPLRRAS